MASTIDVISGGQFELGIGAGWKEDEWLAYDYAPPPCVTASGALGDHLEVIRRMLGPGKATFEGAYARVEGAINVPKGIQSHIPIVVGGNGQNVTFRYAARYADELNLVFLAPDEIREALPVARQRCEEIGRDPSTLRVSLYCRDADSRADGQARVDRLGAYAELDLARIVMFPSAGTRARMGSYPSRPTSGPPACRWRRGSWRRPEGRPGDQDDDPRRVHGRAAIRQVASRQATVKRQVRQRACALASTNRAEPPARPIAPRHPTQQSLDVDGPVPARVDRRSRCVAW